MSVGDSEDGDGDGDKRSDQLYVFSLSHTHTFYSSDIFIYGSHVLLDLILHFDLSR